MNPYGIHGELAFKVDKIIINSRGDEYHDLTFTTVDGNFLRICGENNMVELLENALNEYEEAEGARKEREAIANSLNSVF